MWGYFFPFTRCPSSHLPVLEFLCKWGLEKTTLTGKLMVEVLDDNEVKFWPEVGKNNRWIYGGAQAIGHSCWVRLEQSVIYFLVSFWVYCPQFLWNCDPLSFLGTFSGTVCRLLKSSSTYLFLCITPNFFLLI